MTFAFLGIFVVTHRHFFGLLSSSNPYSSENTAASDLADLVTRLVSSGTPKNHVIYPYSIIPGGVADASELHMAAERDAVVGQHYAGFDYANARMIEVNEPELVYLSYRMKDKIYWTKKPHALHKGEKLISDGKMTARARCGNQVSQQPKAEVSPEEPPEVVFEQPLGDGGTGLESPNNFASLLKGGNNAGSGPPPIGGGYAPGVGGGVPPFAAPPLPMGSCDHKNNKKPCPPPTQPPSTVPEPATIALVGSGIAGLYWKYKKTKAA